MPSSSFSASSPGRNLGATAKAIPKLIAPSKLPDSALTTTLFTLYLSAYFHRHPKEECSATTLMTNSALKLLAKRIVKTNSKDKISTFFLCTRKTATGKKVPSPVKLTDDEKCLKLIKMALRDLVKDGVIVQIETEEEASSIASWDSCVNISRTTTQTQLAAKQITYVLCSVSLMTSALLQTVASLSSTNGISLQAITNHVQEIEDGRWRYMNQQAIRAALEEITLDGSSPVMAVGKDRWVLMK